MCTHTHADTQTDTHPVQPSGARRVKCRGADRWRRCSEGIQKRTNDRETRDSLALNISPFVLVISIIMRHCAIYRVQKFSLHLKNTGKPGTEAKISGIPFVPMIAMIQ